MLLSRRHVVSGLALAASLPPSGAALGAGYRPAPANLPGLGSIADALPRAEPVNQAFLHPPAILARVPRPSGPPMLMFDFALELDTDGFPGDSRNPNWQPNTSLRYGNGTPLDANRVPYLVLPLPRSWPGQFGISLGDYAAVLFEGRVAFAVFGDQGPPRKLGEASLELLRRLGQERLRPNGSVILAGIRPGAVTLVFPGSGDAGDRRDEATLLPAIAAKGRALFTAAGGKAPG